MSEKQSAKRFTIKIGLIGIVVFGGYYWFNTKPPTFEKHLAPHLISSESSQSEKKDEGAPEALQKNLLSESEKCLGFPMALSRKSDFPQLLANLGQHQQEWHWDNYHMENSQGEKIILQVIPDQNKNGVEVKLLKVFRDDKEGPTLIDEKSFTTLKLLEEKLDKKLLDSKLQIKQTVDSFNFKGKLEIRRTAENGEITDLHFQSSGGMLDCQFSLEVASCHCL